MPRNILQRRGSWRKILWLYLVQKRGKRRSLGTILIKKEEYGLFKSSRFALKNLPVKCNGNTIEEELTDSDIFLVSFDVCDLLSFSLGLLQFGFQRKDANPAVDFHVKHRKKVLLVCLHVCFTGRALFQSLTNAWERHAIFTWRVMQKKARAGRVTVSIFSTDVFPRLFGLDFFWLKKRMPLSGILKAHLCFNFRVCWQYLPILLQYLLRGAIQISAKEDLSWRRGEVS